MTARAKPRFIAIGVGQGDAFFFEDGDFRVLVDGGRSAEGFPAQFQRVTGRDGVNVLICTHNDADHALGVLGFLRAGLRCDQVWLPGSWQHRLEDLLTDPSSFCEELVGDVSVALADDFLTLEALAEHFGIAESEFEAEGADPRNCDDIDGVLQWASELALPREIAIPSGWSKRRLELLWDALSAARLIREIATEAYHRGAWIRWFEFGKPKKGATTSGLLPINCREIAAMRRRQIPALAWLALTTVNRESLVFMVPEEESKPAVLFTADSDLRFPDAIPWSDGMIITSPHHGSDSNEYAYERFAKEAASKGLDVIWVRSDGRFFRKRPGTQFLNAVSRDGGFCTLCRCDTPVKQDIRLKVNAGAWNPIKTTRCRCH